MTNKTIEYLKKSGWSIDRNIDIEKYIISLEDDGYEVNSLVCDFLRNYGGLEIRHPHTKIAEKTDNFHFNVTLATESYFPEVIEEYMERVNEKLVVVGECRSGHMVILLSHSGKMFAGYDEMLVKLGDCVEDALVTLCEGHGMELVAK
jgi:hypothetical protein